MPRTEPPSLWRTTFLPAEHGSWAFVLEPPLFGLLWGPSWAGLATTVSVLFGFLAYRPSRLALRDLRVGKRYPRTRFGLAVGGACLALAIAFGAVGVALAGPRLVEPLAVTALFGGLFVAVDTVTRPGHLGRELPGAIVTVPLVAIGLLATNPRLGDWTMTAMLGGFVVAAKSWAAILYVRARLKGRDAPTVCRMAAIAAALIGLAVGVAAAVPGRPPFLAAGFAVLLVRACHGLSPLAAPRVAKHVGFQELGYSMAFYALAALGFRSGL